MTTPAHGAVAAASAAYAAAVLGSQLKRRAASPTIVKSHINHLFAKAGLRDRAQAVNYAYQSGIATPPG